MSGEFSSIVQKNIIVTFIQEFGELVVSFYYFNAGIILPNVIFFLYKIVYAGSASTSKYPISMSFLKFL